MNRREEGQGALVAGRILGGKGRGEGWADALILSNPS